MSADAETLRVYDDRADAYAAMVEAQGPGQALRAFLDLLPDRARILDLGCGPGAASAAMAAAGHHPDPVDASARMVALARARGLPARCARFDELTAEDCYHGVWANFSLLHAPRDALPGHLRAIRRALHPGGVLHLGMKLGEGEGRDRLGRFYVWYGADDLHHLLAKAGFTVLDDRRTRGRGLSGEVAPGILLLARVADA